MNAWQHDSDVLTFIREGCFQDPLQAARFLQNALVQCQQGKPLDVQPTALAEQETIWRNVLNGIGEHGGFLRSFGEAFVRADLFNKALLNYASLRLIQTYALSGPEYREEKHL